MMDAHAGLKAVEARIAPLLGPGAATLLGLSTGFFCYAMPATVIGRAFDPAALGGQGLLAGVAALLVGGATWAGFARFDRPARAHYIAIAAAARETEAAPVLRRADAHPDAPARRPIFAGSDLGTPLDLIDATPVEPPEAIAATPLPALPPPEDVADLEADEDVASAEAVVPAPSPGEPVVAAMPELVTSSLPPSVMAMPPAVASREPVPTLQVMMKRLEAGLARKALVLAGAEPNVTALRREIRPVSGPLADAVEVLQKRTVSRR